MLMHLYVITNLVNGKQYVGITNKPDQRRREHFSGHGSKIVWNAIAKYGKDNLCMEVWYSGDEAWIKLMEQRTILMLETRAPNGYNLTNGGEGSQGWKASEETRARMSLSHLGKSAGPHRPETKRKIADAATGRTLPPEHIFRQGKFKGSQHGCAKPVMVEGTQYGSITEAAVVLGIHPRSLYARLRRYRRLNRWPNGWALPTVL